MIIDNDEFGNTVVNTGYSLSTCGDSLYAREFYDEGFLNKSLEHLNSQYPSDFKAVRKYWFFGPWLIKENDKYYVRDYETPMEIYNSSIDSGTPEEAISRHHQRC